VPTIPDIGGEQTLSGAGQLRGLGSVDADGTLRTPGFILQGRTGAVITLKNTHGTIQVSLTSGLQPGFSGPASTYTYTITGGSGRYVGASGHGTANLVEHIGVAPAIATRPVEPPISGQPIFTLTFHHA
jgi:hypothetical protein